MESKNYVQTFETNDNIIEPDTNNNLLVIAKIW